jgi:hypothetical protein
MNKESMSHDPFGFHSKKRADFRFQCISVMSLAFPLVLLTHCSIIPFRSGTSEKDPIAQVALSERRSQNHPNHAMLEHTPESREIQSAIERGEIILGMEFDDVMTIWGKPQLVEIAGNPEAGNQKWTYEESVNRSWKLKLDRVVYFEGGHVAGWEMPAP